MQTNLLPLELVAREIHSICQSESASDLNPFRMQSDQVVSYSPVLPYYPAITLPDPLLDALPGHEPWPPVPSPILCTPRPFTITLLDPAVAGSPQPVASPILTALAPFTITFGEPLA